MATFLRLPVQTSVTTMKFDTYNAAIDFASKGGMFKPSKPYKRLITKDGTVHPVWCVTLAGSFQPGAKAEYVRIDENKSCKSSRLM